VVPAVPIPRHPTDVTAGWLETVLDAEVRAVDIVPIGTGQTGATYRLTVTYASDAAGLPATFAVKLSSQDDAVRERVALGYRSEHAFYTGVVDVVRVPLPKHYHCEISSEGGDFVLLLADMAPGNADHTGTTGCAQMSADDRDTATAAMSMVTPWLLADRQRFSLMHGDYRLDNVLFDPDRTTVTVVDWQTLGAGLPARDLAYFTGTSLLHDVRRLADEDLVATYHAELSGYGIDDYDRDTCWRDYRVGMLQVPLITVLGCAFAISTERGDDMMLVMLERGCQAIRDLGSLDLVRAL
jgi:hypothetical protein